MQVPLSQVVSSSGNGATYSATFTASADGAVADYSRGVGGECVVVDSHANRDDADLAGHRATDIVTRG